jgi:hypothetical protein
MPQVGSATFAKPAFFLHGLGYIPVDGQLFRNGIREGLPTTRELARSVNTSAFERSRWRGGRFACYAPHVMPQGRAFNFDFRFSLIFVSPAKSISCKRKRIQFP